MRYLAIDYGAKRVGLALCDPSETFVSPLCQLPNRSDRADTLLEQLRQIIQDHHIEAFVVGLPLNMDDSEGPQARQAREFAQRLKKISSLPVYLQDERLSSAAADEKLADFHLTRKKQKQRRDMLAACDILQTFLDHHPTPHPNSQKPL